MTNHLRRQTRGSCFLFEYIDEKARKRLEKNPFVWTTESLDRNQEEPKTKGVDHHSHGWVISQKPKNWEGNHKVS